MLKTKVEKFIPEVCQHCGMTTTYRVGLDKCAALIVLDILKRVSEKGINQVHPARELNWTKQNGKQWYLTNLSVPRFHGLIAYTGDEKSGFYCLTRKAGKFLRNELIPRYAIVSKAEGHQIGYWNPEKYQVSIKELLLDSEIPFYSGEETRFINYIDPKEKHGQLSLFNTNYSYVLRQEKIIN